MFATRAFLLVLPLAAACATDRAGENGDAALTTAGPFPSRDELARVAERKLPPVDAEAAAHVATWTLGESFPDRFGDEPAAPTPLHDALLPAALQARKSASLDCAARELGRFYLAQGKHPDSRLEAYLFGRCGASVISGRTSWLTWKGVPATNADDEVWRKAIADAKDLVAKGARSTERVGIAFVRDAEAGRAVLAVVAAEPAAHIDAAAQTLPPDATSVAVSGAVVRDADVVTASVTLGRLGAQECEPDATVSLPHFRFTCPLAADDAVARIDVHARPRGRFLSNQVADLIVVKRPDDARTYRRPEYTDGDGKGGGDDEPLLAQLNRVRAAAGAPVITETKAQSAVVNRVAPHYFANTRAAAPDVATAELIALGLMAGWDVEELTIETAGFAALEDDSGGGDDLLGSALDQPSFRRLLLDPRAGAAAVAQHEVAPGVTGALVVTYLPLRPVDQARAAAAVMEQLTKARRARGLGPASVLPANTAMVDAVRRIEAGDDVGDVVDAALEAAVTATGRSLGAWTIRTQNLDDMSFPQELLAPQSTAVAVGVATRKARGAAWGERVVLLLGAVDEAQVAFGEARRGQGS